MFKKIKLKFSLIKRTKQEQRRNKGAAERVRQRDKQKPQSQPQDGFQETQEQENEFKKLKSKASNLTNETNEIIKKTLLQHYMSLKCVKSVNSSNSIVNINNFLPNWRSNYISSIQDTNRNRAFLGSFNEYYNTICYTATQPLLFGCLYDAHIFYKMLIDAPVGFAFNNLVITATFNKNTDKTEEEVKKEQDVNILCQEIKRQIITLVTQTEIYGNTVLEIKNDKSKNNVLELNFAPWFSSQNTKIEDENIFYISATNKPQNLFWKQQIMENGGLSFYETIITLARQIEETCDRAFEALKIKDVKALKKNKLEDVDTGSRIISRDTNDNMDKELQEFANNLESKNLLVLKPQQDLLFPNSSGDMSCYQDFICFAMEQATGIPASVFRGENLASINIGTSTDEKPLLKQTINKFRSNYESIITTITKRMQDIYKDFNITFFYEDDNYRDKKVKFENYKNIVDVLATMSNITTNEETAEVLNAMLKKIKEQLK